MAQATVDELEDISANGNTESNQPTVRHIPIFVEGRDEPIINRNIPIHPENIQKPAPTIDENPQSIFSRVKNIPLRKPATNFDIPITTNIGGAARSDSPARTIPIKVEHVQTKPKPPSTMNATKTGSINNIPVQQLNENNARSRSSSPMPPAKPMDSITKIQLIQNEILELMGRVEKFEGTSRQDKEYMYLDEMLTQNLLKLDTIDTEGKENIKAARKEAINCINKCIAVLEAKVEQGGKETAISSADCNETTNSNSNLVTKQHRSSQEKSEACMKPNETENQKSS